MNEWSDLRPRRHLSLWQRVEIVTLAIVFFVGGAVLMMTADHVVRSVWDSLGNWRWILPVLWWASIPTAIIVGGAWAVRRQRWPTG